MVLTTKIADRFSRSVFQKAVKNDDGAAASNKGVSDFDLVPY